METTNSLAWMQVAEIELIYKSKVKASERPKVTTSHDAFKLFKQNWDENKIEFIEQFKVLFLNRNNKVLGIFEVSTGGVSGTVADPKVIFAAALKMNACNIILCHNHPSGSLKPSMADEQLTQKIKEAGKYLDLPVIDHLIITAEDGYFSFADEGLL
ncbi:MAG TPA: JAB domain-containing protein [Parafilimonas sp.]|nr:JAB domain-containing protein [Parafilimonas sp.]